MSDSIVVNLSSYPENITVNLTTESSGVTANIVETTLTFLEGAGLYRENVFTEDNTFEQDVYIGQDLTVAGTISAAQYLNLPATTGNYLPLSGGTITGSLSVTNNLSVTGSTSTDNITFDQTPELAGGVGIMRWNDTDGTVDLGLKGGAVTLQLGQEFVARVVNKTGADLLESQYKVVRIRSVAEGGAQGQRLAVKLAQGDSDPDSITTLGVVTENIGNNQEGFITTMGQVKQINTTGTLQGETWVDGDVLYLSPTIAGALTKVKPIAPQHSVTIGYVEYAHQNNGKIFVKIDNGYELDELHNVRITNPQNAQVLAYNSLSGLWVNADSGGDYLPLSGGTVTGALVVEAGFTSDGPEALFTGENFTVETTNIVDITAPTITLNGKVGILDTTSAVGSGLSGSALNIAQTWNTNLTPTALSVNVTDLSSNAASLLMDLRVGGVSRLSVNKLGLIALPPVGGDGTGVVFGGSSLTNARSYLGQYGLRLTQNLGVQWSASTNLNSPELALARDAANTLAQRNGLNAQESRIYSTYTDASNYERFFIKTNVGATSATQIGLSAAGTGKNRNLEFVAGGSTRMTIQSGGNVGIGTTTPSTKLEITTAASHDGVKLKRADGERVAWLIDEGTGSGALYLFNGNDSNSTFITGNGNSFLNGGNVGIGTATPASGLHVSGALGSNTTTRDSAAALKLTNTSGLSWLLTSGVIGVFNSTFCIRQESTVLPALTITATTNNVGIGTNLPTEKLTVVGNISATGVVAAGSMVKFPDYSADSPPAAAGNAGAMIYVNDDVGGPTMAFCDGGNWLRVRDNAIVTTAP